MPPETANIRPPRGGTFPDVVVPTQRVDNSTQEGLKAHEGGSGRHANPFDMFSNFFGGRKWNPSVPKATLSAYTRPRRGRRPQGTFISDRIRGYACRHVSLIPIRTEIKVHTHRRYKGNTIDVRHPFVCLANV